MDKKRNFLFKFGLSISICTIFLLVLVCMYVILKKIITKNIEGNTRILTIMTANGINSTFSMSQQMPEDLSYVLEYGQFTEDGIKQLLKDIVESNEEIYGSTISYEPYFFEKSKYFFGPYFFKSDGEVRYSELGDNKYNYFNMEWYTTPKKLNKGVWSEPYFDEKGEDIPVVTYFQQKPVLSFKRTGGGEILMLTYSQPFYKEINGERIFSGVVTCDIALNWLQKLATNMDIFRSGYVFILSSNGNYIVHKDQSYVLNENIFSLADKRKYPSMKELGKKMISGQSGFAKYYCHTLKKECFVYYSPLNTVGWSFGVVVPEEELFSDFYKDIFLLSIIGFIGCLLIISLIIILGRYFLQSQD